jgi:hypothetical protein
VRNPERQFGLSDAFLFALAVRPLLAHYARMTTFKDHSLSGLFLTASFRRWPAAALVGSLLLGGLVVARAQEPVPRETALKIALALAQDLKDLCGTPIPTDPDIKRPIGLYHEGHGGLLFPECKLSADTFAKVGKDTVAVGQMWLYKLAPMTDTSVVPLDKLRVVHVKTDEREADAVCCALGARKNADGALELLVYGKDKEPVLRVPLKAISGQQDKPENPIDVSAEVGGASGQITVKFVGKYQATFSVTEPE